MSDFTPSLAFLVALLASAIAFVAFAPPAGAATPCGTRVAEDWRDNSRIDGVYPLHCYDEGIDAIPAEIRDYSNAEEVIRRAYLAAGGRSSVGGPPGTKPGGSVPTRPLAAPEVDTSAASSVPLPVLILAGMSLVLVASGAVGYISRRRGSVDEDALP